ncbi:MAG: tetratricopeptide repeat protein [Gammaproteobacteria bacterium]|nr:tetratricopeptide repeat protein [Gammaproteobacteria bacterium]MCP5423893.1 tetratricopeptide repeat protein [Gammaproteobacteria bacterium]
MSRLSLILLFHVLLSGCAILNTDNGLVDLAQQAQQARAAGRFSDAETAYWALIQAHPEAIEPWFQLGNLYAENGRLEEAQQAYRRALRQGDEPQVRHNLGLVQLQLGIRNLREARQQLPADDPAHDAARQYLQMLLQGGL